MSKECCGSDQQPQKTKAAENISDNEEEETLNLEEESDEKEEGWRGHWSLLTALLILVVMLVLEYGFKVVPPFPVSLIIYFAAFMLSGYNVIGIA